LGTLLQEKMQFDVAAACFREALRLRPDYLPACTGLGYALRAQGRLAEAVAAYQRAVQIRPDSAEIYCDLALTQRILGHHREAAASYQQAVRIEPNDVQHRFLLSALDGVNAPRTAPRDYVVRLFDSYAESFQDTLVEKLGYHVPEKLYHAVRQVVGGPDKKYDALDLGCGTGLCGVHFRDISRRLTGVDLSPKMIEKARETNVYDELHVRDVIDALRAPDVSYDLIVAADVFIYVGDLAPVFDACRTVLRPGGLFVFSLEATDDGESFVLRPTARYAHSVGYIRRLSEANGLNEVRYEKIPIRKEAGSFVEGCLFVLRRVRE
jgi:predicted TPR repeat methyltransferase